MRYRILAVGLALALLLGGCSMPPEAPVVASNPDLRTPAPVTDSSLRPSVSPVPASGGDLTVPSTPEPAPEPEPSPTPAPMRRSSGMTAEGLFTSDALFIGDSHTYRFVHYLQELGLLGEARYMAICGLPLRQFCRETRAPLAEGLSGAEASTCSPEFRGLTMTEALASKGMESRAVYFLLGSNFSWEVTAEDYVEALELILEDCPEATVYLQTIPYSTQAYYERVNAAIRDAWETLEAEAPGRVVLMDTCAALPRQELLPDGLHYSDGANAAWYAFLKEQADAAI